jgi:four helix bundle protein
LSVGVIARHHRQLEAWQLAHGLRNRVVELTSRDPIKRDYDFCNQTVRSARSACRNLAEGFAKFEHKEFARYVNIALASLAELLDSADEALQRRWITQPEFESLNREITSALKACNGLHQYLISTPTPPRVKRATGARRNPH